MTREEIIQKLQSIQTITTNLKNSLENSNIPVHVGVVYFEQETGINLENYEIRG